MSGYYNRNNRGITKKLGPVTAYADAVLAGYKGTREQWAQDMAKLGQNVTQVAQNTKLTTELAAQTRVNTEQVAKDTADVRELAEETSDNAAQVASNTAESNRLAEETKLAAAQAKEDAEYAGAAADNFRVDTTLSEAGKAAEAKTTGEKFARLSEEIGDEATARKTAITQERNRAIARENEIEGLFALPTQEAVDKWLNEHPEATTTVLDASLGVEKFTEDAKKHVVKDYVTPQMFGAKGDGVTDDTEAFNSAIKSKRKIFLPKGKYLIDGFIINDSATIEGEGVNLSQIYLKQGTILLNTNNISFGNLGVTASTNELTCFSFNENAFEIRFNNVVIANFNKAFEEIKLCWNITFDSVHCLNCENAFVFLNDNVTKTTFSLIKCYAENCGNSYHFNNLQYSSLINCAADYNSYKKSDNPYGDGGHGSLNNNYGAYTFINSRNVSVLNCGCENSYGNGAITVISSNITIDGFEASNIYTTKAIPSNYPNYRVGIITFDVAPSYANISNVTATKMKCENISNHIPFIGCNMFMQNDSEKYYIVCDNIHADYDEFVYGETYYNGIKDILILNNLKEKLEKVKGWGKIATGQNSPPYFDLTDHNEVYFEFLAADQKFILQLPVCALSDSGTFFHGTGGLNGYFALKTFSLNNLKIGETSYTNDYTVNIYAK